MKFIGLTLLSAMLATALSALILVAPMKPFGFLLAFPGLVIAAPFDLARGHGFGFLVIPLSWIGWFIIFLALAFLVARRKKPEIAN